MRISLHVHVSINLRQIVSFSVGNQDFLFASPYMYFMFDQILILKKATQSSV